MGIDFVRFSQSALPLARRFDSDKNKTLDEREYKEFETEWNKTHPNESPLLMQLHISTLNESAFQIAQACDVDELKGVLTESEISNFMERCSAAGIKNPFKPGTMLKTVLTGEIVPSTAKEGVLEEKSDNFINNFVMKYVLAKNLAKLTLINFQGSDKYFHAVGNFKAMHKGSESVLKQMCEERDANKHSVKRTETDITEDKYANWLGRHFAKMYPDEEPHNLFSPLAPEGFDIEKSKKSVPALVWENRKGTVLSTVGCSVISFALTRKILPRHKNLAGFAMAMLGGLVGFAISKFIKN